MTVWIAFAVGMFLGANLGIILMCLLQINRREDEQADATGRF